MKKFYANLQKLMLMWISLLRNSQLGGVMYAEDRVTFFPNTTSHFAGPALLDLHFRAVLQAEGGAPLRLEVSGQPLPATAQERGVIAGISGFAMGMVVFAAYSFIATGIAAYVTMEKEVEVKQQLMISGASPLAYWASNLSFDCVFGLFAFVSTMLVMAIFGVREWCSFPNIGATVALLTLFTPAVSLFAYFWSHFFNTSGNAVAGVLMLGLFLGTFGINVSETLSLFPRTRVYGYGALWIIEAVLPSACVGHGLMHLAMFRDISKAMGISPFAGFLTHTEFCSPVRGSLPCVANAGDDCIMLVFDMLLYAALVYVIEIGGLGRWLQRLPFFRDPRCPSSLQRAEGEDVCAERARVAGLDPASQVLVVNDIYKAYRGGVHAVRGITYAVGEGEVFGLLGVNGAGKTTTFRILCGQIAPSAGQVFIRGRRMADDAAGARRLIGYCPQFDALLDLLTAREHLELYAQVKGFEGPGMDAEVRQKLATVDLAGFEHSRAGQLSGGSKRKLSFALSTIGEPEIVFLDEPSAGMDPVARHFMWDVIRSIAQRRPTSAVILTTHSMDEADALCSRIAIQCLGQLRCLGSPQELKQRYGSGLELKVRLEAPRRADVEHLCAEWNGAPDTECPSPDALRLVEQRVAAACAPPTRGGSAILLGALAEWCLLQERAMAVDAFLEERCGRVGRASRVEAAGGSLRYQLVGSCLGGGPMPYAELFALLGERRRALRLADFQLSQGTLEQAFNRLAAEELEGSGLGSGNPSAARRLDGGLMPALQASKQKPS
ncbi:unnamed protein product [Prorocentrum cordatum]|uniref:ABC transporter domain-containing protein n=1 Tax=Prorocentrum cordatum TaxID=2364126 RepID=A0ABN9UBE4_9DINO|nr:unnamed protein product [Polarella glacialis]